MLLGSSVPRKPRGRFSGSVGFSKIPDAAINWQELSGASAKPIVDAQHLAEIIGATLKIAPQSPRDISRRSADTGAMNDITREEFNAKLETIEVKMDARVEAISSKIEGFLGAQAERDKRLDESLAAVRRDIDKLGSLKLNIWGAMLTAVGLGVAITSLSISFYQTGKAEKSEATQPPAIMAPAQPSSQKN
jgi:hypothetical protein